MLTVTCPAELSLVFREYKVFFSFSYVVEYFVHKGNNHIPKREQLSCLAFVFFPVTCLVGICVVGFFFKHTHSTCGAVHKWELSGQRCREEMLLCSTASTTSPWGLTPVLKQSLSMTK